MIKIKNVLAVSIVVILFMIIKIYRDHPHVSEYEEKEFLKNVDACNRLAEIYYDDYKKNNTDLILTYECIESGTIHCYSYNYDIRISSEDEEIFRKALENFRKNEFINAIYSVYVYDTFVSFCDGDDKESVIYSAEDKWPSYVSYPGGDRRKRSKNIIKITDHWYKAYYKGL
ncbi:MAG: hypothetical protein J6L77_08640 [Coprococcus sp.]|nr:hypothetical protein [Coprococcus sp.]